MKLTYPVAVILSQTAVAHAEAMGVPMAVALADAEGDLVHFARMDGVLPASKSIAVDKAYTAAALRMPTDELGRLAQPGETLYGVQHTLGGRAVLFGGGDPLRAAGEVLGALGISGGTVEQDMEICRLVRAHWEQMVQISMALEGRLPPLLSRDLSHGRKIRAQLLNALEGIGNLPAGFKEIILGAVWLQLSN